MPDQQIDAFRFRRWADAAAARRDLTPTEKLLAHALASHANARTGLCCPSRKTLAADIGTSRLKTVSEATAALVAAGLLRVEHGQGNRATYHLQKSASADFQKSATAPEVERQRALPEERQRALPTRNYEGNYEEKRAPVGAAALSSSSSEETTTRADEILALHADLVARQTKLRPSSSPSKQDREAALDLAERLDPDDWADQIDLAMRYGLKGTPYMRGKVVSVAGLAPYIGELLGRHETSEEAAPPAAWDEPDDLTDEDVAEYDAEMRRVDEAIAAGATSPEPGWWYSAWLRFYSRRGEPCPLTYEQWAGTAEVEEQPDVRDCDVCGNERPCERHPTAGWACDGCWRDHLQPSAVDVERRGERMAIGHRVAADPAESVEEDVSAVEAEFASDVEAADVATGTAAGTDDDCPF